jgi:tRNA1Val (adenine37-N6)-methyltransferase
MNVATEDEFLGGRLVVRQPRAGFRAGLDAVMLAAAVPARPGETALELGSGVGTAALCLARRVEGVTVDGIELDAELVDIAVTNAETNALSDRVTFLAGDVLDPPRKLRRSFDHVFCNPPFHGAEGEASPDLDRARAKMDEGRLADWLTAGVKRTRSGGTFTAILRADRLNEALAALPSGGATIFPLWPKAGLAAKRVIVRVLKGARAPLVLAPGLVLHAAGGGYTPEADAVLRGEAALSALVAGGRGAN